MDKKFQKDAEPLTPFQEGVDVRLFFSGAQRRKLLEEVKKAIAEEISVITITGDEGTGKTMICKMVEKELPEDYACVYLPNTLESFDDVIRVLALGLETENSDKPEPTKVLVQEIIHTLEENDLTLVAIFDQAERMYLATIERIRKMLDLVNIKQTQFQIIFAGRKNFRESFEQLSICDFEKVEERHLTLNTLGLSETYAYLNHSAQQRSTGRAKNVFTPEAAKKIYSMAQGNLRMTNILAAKSLSAADSDTSFMVLLDNVDDKKTTKPTPLNPLKNILSFLGFKGWLMAGAGVAAVIIVLLFLSSGGQDSGKDDLAAVEKTQIEAVKIQEKKPAVLHEPQKQIAAAMPPEQQKTNITESAAPEKAQTVGKEQETPNVSKPENPVKIAASEKETVIAAEPEANIVVEAPITTLERPVSEASQKEEQNGEIETENEKRVSTANNQDNQDIVAETSPAVEQTPAEIPLITADKKKKKNENYAPPVTEEAAAIAEAEEEATAQTEPAETVVAAENTIEESPEPGVTQISVAPLTIEEVNEESTAEKEGTTAGSLQEEGLQVEQKIVSTPPTGPEPSQQLQSADTQDVEPLIIAENRKRMPPLQTEVGGIKMPVKIAPVKIGTGDSDTTQSDSNLYASESVDELYRQRSAAGEKWLGVKENTNQTIQLMVLSADRAEENLKQRLEQSEFRDIAEKLYIINNGDSKVFVFFGEYPDFETARQARNTLPVFLREFDPYPLSVEEAVVKATSQE